MLLIECVVNRMTVRECGMRDLREHVTPTYRRFRAAALRNSSMIGEYPYTNTHSLLWMCSCACSQMGPYKFSISSLSSMMLAMMACFMSTNDP